MIKSVLKYFVVTHAQKIKSFPCNIYEIQKEFTKKGIVSGRKRIKGKLYPVWWGLKFQINEDTKKTLIEEYLEGDDECEDTETTKRI